MKSWIVAVILLISGVGSAFPQVTSDVFRAQATFQGVIQSGTAPTNQTIQPVKLTSDDLVNLALGRNRGTTLQANEMLAYASTLTTNTSKLFVYDPIAASNLATVVLIHPQVTILGQNKNNNNSEATDEMTVPGAGNATNGLTSGDFLLNARSVLETNAVIRKFSATAIGYLDAAIQGSNYSILVSTGTITTQGKKIGSLVEGP